MSRIPRLSKVATASPTPDRPRVYDSRQQDYAQEIFDAASRAAGAAIGYLTDEKKRRIKDETDRAIELAMQAESGSEAPAFQYDESAKIFYKTRGWKEAQDIDYDAVYADAADDEKPSETLLKYVEDNYGDRSDTFKSAMLQTAIPSYASYTAKKITDARKKSYVDSTEAFAENLASGRNPDALADYNNLAANLRKMGYTDRQIQKDTIVQAMYYAAEFGNIGKVNALASMLPEDAADFQADITAASLKAREKRNIADMREAQELIYGAGTSDLDDVVSTLFQSRPNMSEAVKESVLDLVEREKAERVSFSQRNNYELLSGQLMTEKPASVVNDARSMYADGKINSSQLNDIVNRSAIKTAAIASKDTLEDIKGGILVGGKQTDDTVIGSMQANGSIQAEVDLKTGDVSKVTVVSPSLVAATVGRTNIMPRDLANILQAGSASNDKAQFVRSASTMIALKKADPIKYQQVYDKLPEQARARLTYLLTRPQVPAAADDESLMGFVDTNSAVAMQPIDIALSKNEAKDIFKEQADTKNVAEFVSERYMDEMEKLLGEGISSLPLDAPTVMQNSAIEGYRINVAAGMAPADAMEQAVTAAINTANTQYSVAVWDGKTRMFRNQGQLQGAFDYGNILRENIRYELWREAGEPDGYYIEQASEDINEKLEEIEDQYDIMFDASTNSFKLYDQQTGDFYRMKGSDSDFEIAADAGYPFLVYDEDGEYTMGDMATFAAQEQTPYIVAEQEAKRQYMVEYRKLNGMTQGDRLMAAEEMMQYGFTARGRASSKEIDAQRKIVEDLRDAWKQTKEFHKAQYRPKPFSIPFTPVITGPSF